MEATWDLGWRPYPAAILTALGLVLAMRGGILMIRGFLAPYSRPGKNLHTMRAMRALLQGISVAAIGLGWWLHWPVMVAAGAIFGFEETIETSIAAWALQQEYDRDSRAAPRTT